MTSTKPLGTLRSVASLLATILIETISSEILYKLRDAYTLFRCCWNVATYKWKVYNGKVEIMSFVLKFHSVYFYV